MGRGGRGLGKCLSASPARNESSPRAWIQSIPSPHHKLQGEGLQVVVPPLPPPPPSHSARIFQHMRIPPIITMAGLSPPLSPYNWGEGSQGDPFFSFLPSLPPPHMHSQPQKSQPGFPALDSRAQEPRVPSPRAQRHPRGSPAAAGGRSRQEDGAPQHSNTAVGGWAQGGGSFFCAQLWLWLGW